jgi:hypothetical protein
LSILSKLHSPDFVLFLVSRKGLLTFAEAVHKTPSLPKWSSCLKDRYGLHWTTDGKLFRHSGLPYDDTWNIFTKRRFALPERQTRPLACKHPFGGGGGARTFSIFFSKMATWSKVFTFFIEPKRQALLLFLGYTQYGFVITSLLVVRGDDLQRPLAPRAAVAHQTNLSAAMAGSYTGQGLFRGEQQSQIRGSCSGLCGFGVVDYFDAGAGER